MLEEHSGSLWFQRNGQLRCGAWIISYQSFEKAFQSEGRPLTGIDKLLIPKTKYPMIWDGYKDELIPNAWENYIENIKQK